MSHSVPRQQSLADAARRDVPSTPPVDRLLPDFPSHPHASPHSPIEREIERSERASAALAAARVVARASFTDSQLAADDAAGEGDIDTSGWIRTEYAALDHAVRSPQDDPPQGAAPRNLVGGTFNPGIASQHGRAFPGASLADASIRTRTGAQARFLQESRQTPRVERVAGGAPKTGHASAAGHTYDKPAVMPMLAPAMAPVPAKAATPARTRASAPTRARPNEPFRFMLAAGLGAVIVLVGGGVAWKAGVLSHNSATNAALVTARVAAQAEAARVLSAAPQEIAITPAAGTPTRTNEEVDAALAAAARAAAVPVASVHAAGPSRVARPQPLVVTSVGPPVAVAPAVAPTPAPAVASPVPQRAPVHAKESVADAIAHAQARADSFLATGAAAPATTEVKPGE